MSASPNFVSGFVALVGRPNAGKSTLLNQILGRKVAIVSPHPQTTRTHLLGILDAPAGAKHPAAQVVFVDTPGVHKARTPLNREMMRHVRAGLEGRDLALLLVDVTRTFGEEDAFALDLLRPRKARTERDNGQEDPEDGPLVFDDPSDTASPETGAIGGSAVEDETGNGEREDLTPENSAPDAPTTDTPRAFLVLNKVDALPDKRQLLPIIEEYRQRFPFLEVFPISARTGENVPALLDAILCHLPPGPEYFAPGQVTDQPEQFQVAELIREKAMVLTREEVPHTIAVQLERYDRTGDKLRIAAVIFCERPGQKAILIGRGGEMMKRIGIQSREDIEALLGVRVFLELHVLVREHWRHDPRFLSRLDWREGSEL